MPGGGNMGSSTSKIQRNESRRSFRGARLSLPASESGRLPRISPLACNDRVKSHLHVREPGSRDGLLRLSPE
jgi:hypothetical protein